MDPSSAIRLFAKHMFLSPVAFMDFTKNKALMASTYIYILYRWYRFTYTCIMHVQQFAISMVEVM